MRIKSSLGTEIGNEKISSPCHRITETGVELAVAAPPGATNVSTADYADVIVQGDHLSFFLQMHTE